MDLMRCYNVFFTVYSSIWRVKFSHFHLVNMPQIQLFPLCRQTLRCRPSLSHFPIPFIEIQWQQEQDNSNNLHVHSMFSNISNMNGNVEIKSGCGKDFCMHGLFGNLVEFYNRWLCYVCVFFCLFR